jgi:hypothetical protein
MLILHDENLKRHFGKKKTGSELIAVYDKYKQNYFTKMQKALFPNEPKEVNCCLSVHIE